MARILAVDDSLEQLLAIEMHLRGDEFVVTTATNGRQALELCQQEDFDLILLDVRMPRIDGFETCRRLKSSPRTAFVPVIFLTGHFSSESRRQEAYALGAVDYVQKPVGRDELVARIRVMLRMQLTRNRLTLENARLARELAQVRRCLEDANKDVADLRELAELRAEDADPGDGRADELVRQLESRRAASIPDYREESSYTISGFIGQSESVRVVERMVDRLRSGFRTVLVVGESGTGKEIVARALHFDGPANSTPFIPIHCGAISRDLVESELFGYEKGSFTGAQESHEGLFAAADGGVVFLDEVAEMPLDLQVKLLRVLQLGEIRPIGSTQHRVVNVRVIAATNADLRELVKVGKFREDLYYRLQGVTLELPPLRDRLDDIPLLVEHFLKLGNQQYERDDRPVRGVAGGAMDRLRQYAWPGNVREFEKVFDRVFALGVGELVQEEDLPAELLRKSNPANAMRPATLVPLGGSGGDGVDDEDGRDVAGDGEPSLDIVGQKQAVERRMIEQALQLAGGNKVLAARNLGLPRSTFYRRLRKLGL